MTELPHFTQNPMVEVIGPESVNVTFSSWQGSSAIFEVQGYRVEYKSQQMEWTTFSTVDHMESEGTIEVTVTGLKVCFI